MKAWHVELHTPHTHHESTELTRIGAAEIKANPDGISLDGPMMEALKMAGFLTAEKMDDPEATAYKETQNFYDGLIETAPSFAWLTSNTNSRKDQLASGAHWVRIHLAATQLGIAMQPLSQVLQEFPEMNAHFDELHAGLGMEAPKRVQGLFPLRLC